MSQREIEMHFLICSLSTVNTIIRQKRRSEGYLLVLLVHGFLVLRESRRSLSVEPVQLVTLWAKVTCTGMNGVKIMTRVPRRHPEIAMVNEDRLF